MAWMNQHSKNKSCNESMIVTNRSGKTPWLFGRPRFAFLFCSAFFWVGSSSARAELSEAQVTAAVFAGIMQAFTTAPLSFGGNGQNVVPWLWPDLNGLTLGEFLVYASGFDPSTTQAKTLRSILEDIQSAIESNPSLSSEDLENLFDDFFTSQSVSLGNLVRPQYEFFADLQNSDDDAAVTVLSYFRGYPDWASFFDAVYTVSMNMNSFANEYRSLIDDSPPEGEAWRVVWTAGQMETFEGWKDDIVDAVQNQQDSFSDISSALGLMTNQISDLDEILGDLFQTVADWRDDFLDYVHLVTDREQFYAEAQNIGQHVNDQVVDAKNDAQQALDNVSYQAEQAMAEDKDPTFTSDIIPNPYDPLLGLYDQVTSKVGDKVPSASDYNFSPKMTLLYENKEVWGRGVNKIEIDLSKPNEWAPGIGADFNQKITTVMRWLWELVVNVSTIAIVLRYIGKIHENMV